jgi:hypothetical protein
MPHTLAPDLGLRNFNAALFAHDTAVLQTLVLAAQAFVVLDRPENLGAEQAIALGLEGAVVDGLGLLDLTLGPRPDHLRRCQPDADKVEILDDVLLLEQSEQIFHLYHLSLIRRSGRDRY